MSVNCSNVTTNASLADLIDGEYYRPELVFSFRYIGDDIANDYILDWIELVWSGYFAIFFGTLGSQLRRCSQFVFQLRVFGFYGIWTAIRRNPAFVDAVLFERFLRCSLSAGLGAIVAVMIKAEDLVELYTIITVGSGHLINVLDPYLRREGDCKDIGPPTAEFPYGVWVDCGNWTFAYAVTWINSLYVYLMLGIFLFTAKTLIDKFAFIRLLKRQSIYVAVSMIATNSACTFITALRRRYKIHEWQFDLFVQYSYYILLGSFYMVQVLIECISKCYEKRRERELSASMMDVSSLVRSKTWRIQSYCCGALKLVSMIFWGFTMPLYLADQAVKFIIRKIIKINTKTLEEEDKKYRRSQREITVDEYWMKVKDVQKTQSASTDVEMVAGGISLAKMKSESMAGRTKDDESVYNALEIEKLDINDVNL